MSRYRTQGSLIGSYRTPSSTTASGVYDVTGATTYTSANLWAGTTPVSTVVTVSNPMTSGNGIYVPTGGTVTTVGEYQIITFTGSGSFTVNQTGNVELMMIGGGGGSGRTIGDNGASSGGMIYYGSNPWVYSSGTSLTLTSGTTYTVTIGAGGPAAAGSNQTLVSAGANTTVVGGSINLTAFGGNGSVASSQGAAGAGSAYYSGYTADPAPNQGYRGGGRGDQTIVLAGGGGCGSRGEDGYTGSGSSSFGDGGSGFLTDISGTLAYYGGGGGGGGKSSSASGFHGTGGAGGGGDGAYFTAAANVLGTNAFKGVSGTVNSGGGGGGSAYISGTSQYNQGGGAGGSGILIMKVPLYNIDPSAITAAQTNLIATGNAATGGTVTYSGNYRIHTFTGSGTFTAAHTGYIEYLLIGGGGGASKASYSASSGISDGGSGGGGGFLEHYSASTPGNDFQGPRMFVNSGDTITVVVGAGGQPWNLSGNTILAGATFMNGSDSYIFNPTTKQHITAYGGGGGGTLDNAGSGSEEVTAGGQRSGRAGGSGGGFARGAINLNATAVTITGRGGAAIGGSGGARQGFEANVNYFGGGAGSNTGAGRESTITGSSVFYAKGGERKGTSLTIDYAAAPNLGIGGSSGRYTGDQSGVNGLMILGLAGGSGIVIIRYRFQ